MIKYYKVQYFSVPAKPVRREAGEGEGGGCRRVPPPSPSTSCSHGTMEYKFSILTGSARANL